MIDPLDVDEFAYVGGHEIADALRPARRRSISVGGRVVSGVRWGTEPAEFFFVHGGGLNARTWDQVIGLLARPALAVDLPGHGRSDWREDVDYTPQTNADALEGYLRDAPIASEMFIVGHSLGAMTGIALASRVQNVSGLVLVDMSPGIRRDDTAQVRNFLAGPASYASRAEIVERAWVARVGNRSRELLERGVALNTTIGADGRVRFRHHLAQLPDRGASVTGEHALLWPALESLDLPILLVRGRDGFLPEPVRAEFAGRLPHVEIVDLDAGHNVHQDAPRQLVEALRAFRDTARAARSRS